MKNIADLINTERLLDCFVDMAKVDTGADDKSDTVPSSQAQIELALKLKDRLLRLGLSDADVSEFGILTATLPSNMSGFVPAIGFISHLDTSIDVSSGPVNPIIHNYQGGDIVLKGGTFIPAKDLEKYKGLTIITADGTTLLGADDKAGIAEIIEALAVLQENPDILHPCIKVAFTPDEEIGGGMDYFDIKKFGADVAYTVDGESPADVETENFNAFNPKITIKGVAVHTGYAYHKMISAAEIAHQFVSALPYNETPAMTKDKQGFYHIASFSGNASCVTINMGVRDFSYNKALKRIDFLQKTLDKLQKKYPQAQIDFQPNPAYFNMGPEIDKFPEMIQLTKEAVRKSGFKPREKSIRGGTDGSNLSLAGLLSPNIGAGGRNFHSEREFIPVKCMVKATENILHISELWATKSENLKKQIMIRRNLIEKTDGR